MYAHDNLYQVLKLKAKYKKKAIYFYLIIRGDALLYLLFRYKLNTYPLLKPNNYIEILTNIAINESFLEIHYKDMSKLFRAGGSIIFMHDTIPKLNITYLDSLQKKQTISYAEDRIKKEIYGVRIKDIIQEFYPNNYKMLVMYFYEKRCLIYRRAGRGTPSPRNKYIIILESSYF